MFNYIIESKEDNTVLHIKNREASYCPKCGSLCTGYDTRSRKVISGDGLSVKYQLRRVYCKPCKALHIELPDFIHPHKQYGSKVIKTALSGINDDCPAENSTIWRWKKNYPPTLQ